MRRSRQAKSNITKSLSHLTAIVVVVLVSMSLLLTGCFDISEGGYSPVWSPDGRKIVFVDHQYDRRGSRTDIWVMDANGDNRINLTNNSLRSFSEQPAWSPDGTRIAFASDKEGNSDIWATDVNGNNLVNLTNSPTSDIAPAYSPDGKTIAFVSFQGTSSLPEIMAIDSDGGNPRRVSGPNTNRVAVDPQLIWSPDGNKILFVYGVLNQNRENQTELWVMNADGTNQTLLLKNARFPTWSSDGNKVACIAGTEGRGDVWIMNSDGSSLRQLTTNGACAYHVWSADGTKIFFLVMSREGPGDIWVMNKDGSDAKSLQNPKKVAVPASAWSPDRGQIAFVSTSREPGLFRPGHVNIWVMNIDGTGLKKLTD